MHHYFNGQPFSKSAVGAGGVLLFLLKTLFSLFILTHSAPAKLKRMISNTF